MSTTTDQLFEAWMRDVDEYVQALIGLSVYDLPDQPYRDWFEDEMDEKEAAELAIEEA